MTDTVIEDELHAFADGALSDARRLEIEAWLAAHPADAARVQAWAAQNQALHGAFDSVLNEPLPIQLVRAARRPRRAWPWRALAAGLAVFVSGLLGYGIGVGTGAPSALRADGRAALPPLARDAAVAHAVFSPEARHPVEVDAAHEAHLVQWLSRRVGTELRAPKFDAYGFELLGGRLLSGETGPVAQFMYQDSRNRRLTLYVRRAAVGHTDTAFRHASENGVDVFYWIDRDFGYALSGQLTPSEMRPLATAAYTQLLGPSPR